MPSLTIICAALVIFAVLALILRRRPKQTPVSFRKSALDHANELATVLHATPVHLPPNPEASPEGQHPTAPNEISKTVTGVFVRRLLQQGCFPKTSIIAKLSPIDGKGEKLPWSSNHDQWWMINTETSLVIQVCDDLDRNRALKIYFTANQVRRSHYSWLANLAQQHAKWFNDHLCTSANPVSPVQFGGGGNSATLDVLVMPWMDGSILNTFIIENRTSPSGRKAILSVAVRFRNLAKEMRDSGWFHGDYCPGNILVIKRGDELDLVFLDGDSFGNKEHPQMLLSIKGHKHFQPVARFDKSKENLFSETACNVDFPSEFIVYLSLLAYAADGQLALEDPVDGHCMAINSPDEEAKAVEILLKQIKTDAACACIQKLVSELHRMLSESTDPGQFVSLESLPGLPALEKHVRNSIV